MIKIISTKGHSGFYGDNSKKQVLKGGETGIAQHEDDDVYIITSCGNCGDYSWISVKDILDAIKKLKKKQNVTKSNI